MFRFARYLFLLFIVTTMIPLLSMFVWFHFKMEHLEDERTSFFLEEGARRLRVLSDEYFEEYKDEVLAKLDILQNEKINYSNLKKIFNDYIVEKDISGSFDKVETYYEVIETQNAKSLYLTVALPVENKLILVKKPVKINKFMPAGPFVLKVYSGSKISEDALISTTTDLMKRRNPPGNFLGKMNPPHGAKIMSDNMKPGFDFHQPGDHMQRPIPRDLLQNPGHDHNEFMAGMKPEFLMGPSPDLMFSSDKKPMEKLSDLHKEVCLQGEASETAAKLVLKIYRHDGGIFNKPFENTVSIIIFLAAMISSLLIGAYINGNFIKPLLLLSKALNKIRNGDFSCNIDTSVKQEQIQNTFDNFNKLIKWLKEKDELRNSFITNLTHDLRTPLIAQERSLELISKEFEELGLDQPYRLSKGIEKNNKHLLRMVNLILESYRFDSDKVDFTISKINLKELVDSCFEKVKPLAEEKNIDLINKIDIDFEPVDGDSTSLTRVFVNLVMNSIENIEYNKTIIISAAQDSENLEIVVEDNGPGISKEDIAYIFDRYYTGKSDERKIGSGLGLYVCRKLIKMHKGYISVESELGKFTKFIIKIPRSSM